MTWSDAKEHICAEAAMAPVSQRLWWHLASLLGFLSLLGAGAPLSLLADLIAALGLPDMVSAVPQGLHEWIGWNPWLMILAAYPVGAASRVLVWSSMPFNPTLTLSSTSAATLLVCLAASASSGSHGVLVPISFTVCLLLMLLHVRLKYGKGTVVLPLLSLLLHLFYTPIAAMGFVTGLTRNVLDGDEAAEKPRRKAGFGPLLQISIER